MHPIGILYHNDGSYHGTVEIEPHPFAGMFPGFTSSDGTFTVTLHSGFLRVSSNLLEVEVLISRERTMLEHAVRFSFTDFNEYMQAMRVYRVQAFESSVETLAFLYTMVEKDNGDAERASNDEKLPKLVEAKGGNESEIREQRIQGTQSHFVRLIRRGLRVLRSVFLRISAG